jgi:transcription initiation factor TFIIIB Brf1 subunit/transcription initiation factor TFIIB
LSETLGSLVDKLAIKNIRLYNLRKERRKSKKKIDIVESQRNDLIDEINQFLAQALTGKVKLRDEKVKLYRQPKVEEKISETLGALVDRLCERNSELWHLEDEARRSNVDDTYIGRIKRKVDVANQSRNDLIDQIDELLEKKIKESK